MVSLFSCLQGYSQAIGNECQKLGKTEGKGLFRKKILMSYDMDKGWKCVKLNLMQLFFRRAFGSYQSTHLDTIVRGWNRSIKKECIFDNTKDESSQNLVSKFDCKIHDIWSKTYQKPFPTEIFFNAKNHSFVETVTEGKNLSRHVMNQYANIELIAEDKNFNIKNTSSLEREVKELVEDLPELITFFVSNPTLREKRINFSKKIILDNLEKLKNKEIELPELEYLILAVIQKSTEPEKKSILDLPFI